MKGTPLVDSTATTLAPMPEALCASVRLVGASPPERAADPLPQQPAATADVLRRVDALYSAFVHITELTGKSLAPESDQEHCLEDATKAVAEYSLLVAELQAAIRSKVHQTARFAMLQELQMEIQERQTTVTKMEATLHATRLLLQ